MTELRALKQRFTDIFGSGGSGSISDSDGDIRVFHAPGRVNLIGEHTDYNGGYVFPAALTFGTTLLIRRNPTGLLRLASLNFPLTGEFELNALTYEAADGWMNYPKGMVFHLMQHGFIFSSGYDMLFDGRIPNGSGLSSSASIEVVTGFGLLSMENETVDTVQLALIAQEAENRFVGVNCGIMDQFSVANGKREHALLLMCDTLEHSHVPFRGGAYKIVIGNTNKRRGLVESAYNTRRSECEQAVSYLRSRFPDIRLLGELSLEQYNEAESIIPDTTIRKRARHVMEENDRVLRSIDVLTRDDLAAFGELMTVSHRSLQHLYEVTGNELDALVDAALAQEGVLGSRMTGAGFGGCTVSLVHVDKLDRFIRNVGQLYLQQTGLKADFYVCDIGDGVKEVV